MIESSRSKIRMILQSPTQTENENSLPMKVISEEKETFGDKCEFSPEIMSNAVDKLNTSTEESCNGFSADSIYTSGDIKWRAVFVEVSEVLVSDKLEVSGEKDNRRKRVIQKLEQYYGSQDGFYESVKTEKSEYLPTSPSEPHPEVPKKCEVIPLPYFLDNGIVPSSLDAVFSEKSENVPEKISEHRILDNNDNVESSFHSRMEVAVKNLHEDGSAKKKLSPPRPSSSSQLSLCKYSPGKLSPTRRRSIMHPLKYSPVDSDYMDRKLLDLCLPSTSLSNISDDIFFSKISSSISKNVYIPDGSTLNTEISSVKSDDQSGITNRKRKQEPDCSSLRSAKRMRSEMNNLDKKDECPSSEESESKRKKPGPKPKAHKRIKSTSEEYEVEYLESHKILDNNECMFFVKWVGWECLDNSWEPITNLLNCQEKLVNYFEKLLKAGKHQEIEILLNNSALSELRITLSLASEEELSAIVSSYRTETGLKLPVPNKEFIEKTLHLLAKQRPEDVSDTVRNRLRHELLIEKIWVRRKAQLNALKEWELEINFLADNSALITVENEFDLEGPPPNFHYVNHYVPSVDVVIPNDPPFGCDCPGGCNKYSQGCCGKESGFAYSNDGRIRIPHGTPIYECNNRCLCDINCKNRVIQRGSRHSLCIFKTFNGCGWGVKTTEDIKKGTYITKYVGEVINEKEAAVRASLDSNRFYLFDLDFNSPGNAPCPFTVDASVYGNIAHFINHSCDPNLGIYAAWINCLDPNIPLLVLFALKDIEKGEELCFSYSRTDKQRRKGEVKCKCQAPNCRKYVF